MERKAHEEGFVLTKPTERYSSTIAFARLLALRIGLRMEARGMRMNRGRTALAIVKEEFGFKGNRDKVAGQLEEVIDAMKEANRGGN